MKERKEGKGRTGTLGFAEMFAGFFGGDQVAQVELFGARRCAIGSCPRSGTCDRGFIVARVPTLYERSAIRSRRSGETYVVARRWKDVLCFVDVRCSVLGWKRSITDWYKERGTNDIRKIGIFVRAHDRSGQ